MIDALHDLALQHIRINAHALEHLDRSSFRFFQQTQQDMLRPDIIMSEGLRFLYRSLHHPFGPRRIVRVIRRIFCLLSHDTLDLTGHFLKGEPQGFHRLGCHTFFFMQESEKDMLRTDIILLKILRGILCKLDGLDGPVREMISIIHGCSSRRMR